MRPSILMSLSPSSPIITPGPVVDLERLLARQAVSTCGFVRGNSNSPLTCPSGYSCTSVLNENQGWACCDQIECVGDYRTCVNAGEQMCNGLDGTECSDIYGSILSCPQSLPSCFVYERSRSLGDYSTVSSWACGTESTPVMVLVTTTKEDGRDSAPTSSDQADSSNIFGIPQTTPDSPSTTPSPHSHSGIHFSTGVIVIFALLGCAALGGLWLYLSCCCWPAYRERRALRKRRLMPFTNQGDPANWGGQSNTNTATSLSSRARLEEWHREQERLRLTQGYAMSNVGSNRGGHDAREPNGSQYGGSTVRDYYG